MSQVAGFFYEPLTANHAVASLLSIGLTKDDISLLMSSEARKTFESATRTAGDRAVEDTAIGAGAGGILGGLIAGLTTVAAIAIPGAQLLVVGPLVAVLSGVGTGAALGGLAGIMTAVGFSAAESSRYAKEIKEGKVVVVAHTKDEQQTAMAREVLSIEGADRIKAA